MFLQVENLLSAAEVQSISEIALQAKFVDGKFSNPHNTTKNNLVGDPADAQAQKAGQIAHAALLRNEQVKSFVMPRRVALPALCRYEPGMHYGPHVDAAFLPVGPPPLRSDVSCTIFLGDPAASQGGELLVYLGTQTLRFKGPPGSAVFYPSTTVHEVTPVVSGARLVMITFIESSIPDQMQRDLLYALDEVRALEGLKMDWHNRTRLSYVITNLRRMWAR
ncbi:MAG: Fe2+-dependent dioxygenase [Nevskia sp.]|nr:Fe2+-dependent dioxygenase [Nevskia sp.]